MKETLLKAKHLHTFHAQNAMTEKSDPTHTEHNLSQRILTLIKARDDQIHILEQENSDLREQIDNLQEDLEQLQDFFAQLDKWMDAYTTSTLPFWKRWLNK